MWWYNIPGDNEGIISNILIIYPFTEGYVLLSAYFVALERENYEPILSVKTTKWRKFIDYFGLSIEADPSKVGKKRIYFSMLDIYQYLHL